MKLFNIKNLVVLFILFFGLYGCQNDDSLLKGMKPVHWDRDICERCDMIISERNFAVQIVNPLTNKSYMYDDFGCAVLWFKEQNLDWFDKANIFITDANTGKWLNAREAVYIGETRTPMNYGFSAFSKDSTTQELNYLTFDEVVQKIKNEY